MSLKARTVLVTVAVSSLSIVSGLHAANAPADAVPERITVQFADLNLDRPADVAALYERINLAAEQVCQQRALNGAYVISARYGYCVSDTVYKTVARINHPSLTGFSKDRDPTRVASATVR
jgi:UrcA family protein